MAPPTRTASTASAEPVEPADHSDTHPALHPSVTNVPVTPGVHLSGQSAYINPDEPERPVELHFDPDTATPGPSWNSNSYFTRKDNGQAGSPTEAAAGAKTGEDLLNRLSLNQEPSSKRDL